MAGHDDERVATDFEDVRDVEDASPETSVATTASSVT